MRKMEPKKSQVSPRTVWTIGVNVLAIVAILLLIYFTREIFILLLGALVLTGAINPIIVWLEERGWKRGYAVLAFFALAVVLTGVAVISFIPIFQDQVVNLISTAPDYIERLQETSLFKSVDSRFQIAKMIKKDIARYTSNIGLFFFGFLTGFFKGIFAIVSILVLTIFMLVFGEEILGRALTLVGHRRFYLQLLKRMQRSVGGYVIGTLVIASIGGAVIVVTLLILGVPYFLPLGVIMIIFGLIPYIGPIIAAVVIVGITLVSTDIKSAIIVGIIFVTYQQVENHLLQPLVQRRTIEMNPLLIIIAMFLGTSLAGIVGAILALPVAGAIQVLFRGFVANHEPRQRNVSPPK